MSVAVMPQFYQTTPPVRHHNCVAPGAVAMALASRGVQMGMINGLARAPASFPTVGTPSTHGQFTVPLGSAKTQLQGQGMTMMPAASTPSTFPLVNSVSRMSDHLGQGAGQGAARDGVVLCIGDSLTAGVKNTPNAYPANLEKLLRESGFDFRFHNEGVYAETSDSLLQRLPHVIANASRFGPVRFIFVLTGTNDILQFRTPESILANLRRMHDVAAAAPGSPHVGALTIPQCRLFRPQQETMRSVVNAGIKQICQLSAPRPRFLVDLETVNVDLAEDGVHYVGQGYKEFALLANVAMRNFLQPAESTGA